MQMYLRAGVYYPFIKDLVDSYPRNQIYIVKAEEYFKDRARIMKDIFSFLDVGKILRRIYNEKYQCVIDKILIYANYEEQFHRHVSIDTNVSQVQ